MAKKSRRAKAKHRARMAQAAQVAQEGHPQQLRPLPADVQSPTQVSPKVQASKVQDLTSRYQYVLPEVKRVGIIAGAIILVLIILSFILG
jgi:hypothetical protein